MSARRSAHSSASAAASGQPAAFECDVKTGLGSTIHVRAIRPDDGPRLAAFHQALSPETVYLRFFSAHPKLSAREVERFTNVDYADRLALIAEVDGTLVAVTRYDRTADTREAEVAFVVADEWQHHGIATTLLELLARAAWLSGIDTFTAATLPQNTEMLRVFTHSGFPVTTHVAGGVVGVRFSIAPGYHHDRPPGSVPPNAARPDPC